MRYTALGKTGMSLSHLGFGASSLGSVFRPTNLNDSIKAVETAKQGKDTAINNANKYRNEQIPAAEANADKIQQNAEAQKTARIAEAEGQVARFNAMYKEYANSPLITKQRLFYETMEDVLPELKVIISDGETQTMYPLESFSSVTESAAEEGN